MLLRRKDPLAAFHCISLTSEEVTSFLCLLNIHVFSSINFVPILCLVFFHIKFFYLLFHMIWKWTFSSQLVKNPPACRRPRFNSWAGKICWRRDRLSTSVFFGFPCGSAEKESARNAGDPGLIPGLGRFPGEGKSYPFQYSGLEIPWSVYSMEVQRVGHNWATFTFTSCNMFKFIAWG